MAGYVQLSSLLNGPTTHIEHDESGDGSFRDLTGSLPLLMLTYFSSTIRDEHRVSLPPPPLSWASHAQQTWFEGHQQSHSYYMTSVNAPTRIRVIGGDPTAHLDIIHWMTSCCQQNTIIPLSSIIASPARFILAMTSIRILGITVLDHELPNLFKRLENEMVDIDTAGKVFASGDSVLPEVRKSICTCVAGYFFAGRLQDVDRWMYLGKMNQRFHEGVCRVLDGTRDKQKLEVWLSKDAQTYTSRIKGGTGGHGPSSIREEPGYRIPGAFPSSNVRVDRPNTHHPSHLPPPPAPTIPHHGYWQRQNQPAYRPFEHDPVPPQILSSHTCDELRPIPGRRTPSPSTTISISPSPRTRHVRFDDTSRAHRAPTPPPAGWTSYDPRQPASSGPQYQPYVDPYYQHHTYPAHGSFPQQSVPHPSFTSSRPEEYSYRPYHGGEYYYRHY